MRQELENRLVTLAQKINKLTGKLDNSFMSLHLSKQVVRSSSSAALNYGEAQGAESRKDFIHKIGIVLKELRETQVCLKILSENLVRNDKSSYEDCFNECNHLVAIFHKTIITAKSNLKNLQ